MHYICIASWLAMLVAIAPASPGNNLNQRAAARTRRTTSSIDLVNEESIESIESIEPMAEPWYEPEPEPWYEPEPEPWGEPEPIADSIPPSDLFTAEQVIEGQIELLKSMTESSPWWIKDYMDKAIGALERVVRGNKCPDGFESIGGCCYHFSNSELKLDDRTANWTEAVTNCKDLGEAMTPKLSTNLAEVGQADYRCDDVAFMAYIGEHHLQDYGHMWFGAKYSGRNWVWQQTYTIFPLNSNMWWSNSPVHVAFNHTDTDSNCLMTRPGNDATVAPRAYFDTETCNTHYQYVCQIFY